MQPTKKICAAIFDLDGVIIDSLPHHHQAWRASSQMAGVPFVEELFEKTFGMRNEDIIPTLYNITDIERITEISNHKEKSYREAIKNEARFVPGFPGFIAFLKSKNIPVAIGTSAGKENVDLVFDILNLAEFFSTVVRGDEVLHGKPAPDIFLEAARRLGTNPENTVVFEDAIPGIQAANAAGMTSVGVATTHPADQLQMANFVINNFTDTTLHQLFSQPR